MNNSKLPAYISFKVPLQPESIRDFICTLLDEISKYVLLPSKILSNLKLVVTELCTNFIKHVKNKIGVIEVVIEEGFLLIKQRSKEDTFKKVIKSKLNFHSVGEIVEVHFTETNNHYIKILADNRLQFLNPVKLGWYTDVLKDHFGLHIITIVSDEFLYEYNRGDCFIVRLNYELFHG